MKNAIATFPLEKFSGLIASIYDGLLEPIPWEKCLLGLRSLLEANYVTLILRQPSVGDHGLMVNVGDVTTEGLISYNSHFFAMDPFVGLPGDRMVTLTDILDEKAWLASPFYQEFLKPYDVHRLMGADIRTADGGECRLRVCRGHGAPNFSSADKELCGLLLPHFRRAVHFHGRLDLAESERRLYAGAMDRLMVATIILDKHGRVLKTNTQADELLAAADGMRLVGNMPHATHASGNRELQRLIKHALEGRLPANRTDVVEAISLERQSGKRNLGVVVHTVQPSEWSEGTSSPAAAIYIRDPEHKAQAPIDIVRQLFNFTPAEAGLAVQLANGLSLEDAALELGIRRNTARAHLRAIFSKTDVTRQTELVRLLLNSVANMGIR
ncbi:helix-turn-helix transcriptional regulator [Pseudoduganella sp. UC29_106]|uniref:helix-turn-helix transcriptional regulator n=1 Tax=Pseudoduganella sp. UC29_106 TaxID=3374553 RepID=UPI0037575DCC